MAVPNLKNRVGMTVSGTPGTGTITLNAADTDYQSFATAYGADANVDVLIVEDSAWEVARDCTYTHSGTTLSRGTLEASSTGSALSLTSAAKVYVTETAERMRREEMGYLEHSSHDGTAAVTGVVGTLHVFTGLTANRDFTLPAAAAVGDRIGITFPVGSASYAILLKSASGDKINNVDCSTTEWSRLFIAGETVIFRCIDASTVDWVVEMDGRIPCVSNMHLTTSCDGETAATYTQPTSATTPGAWTSTANVGNCGVTSTGKFITRRAGSYFVNITGRPKDSVTNEGNYVALAVTNAAGTIKIFAAANAAKASTASVYPNASGSYIAEAAGEEIIYKYSTEPGGIGLMSDANPVYTRFFVGEVL